MKYFLISFFLFIFFISTLYAEMNFNYDYELPEQIPNIGPGGAFEFGYFWPAIGDLNHELKSMGLANIGAGATYGGTIGYSFSPNFQLAYEGTGWNGKSSGIINNVVKTVTISSNANNLALIYKLPWGKSLNLSLGIAPGFYIVNYKKEITSGTYHYGDGQSGTTSISELEGSCLGIKVFTSFKYVLNPIISFGVSLGWQYAKIKELFQAGVRMNDAPIIDLSGFYLKLGANLNF